MGVRRRVVLGLLPLVFASLVAVGFGFWHAGYRAYVIHTGSMESTLMPGDLIIDRPASHDLRPGEIITFRHSAGPDLVTHRITDITPDGIHTKGDANATADVWTIPPSFVQGSVRWQLPGLGYAVTFLKQPTGFVSVVAAVIGVILLWDLFFLPTPAAETEPAADSDAPVDLSSAANPWTEPTQQGPNGPYHPDGHGSRAETPSTQDTYAPAAGS